MRRWLSRNALVLVIVAFAAASAGASGMYAVIEFGPWAPAASLNGEFVNATLAQVPSGNFTFPVLNASLNLFSPSSLDPAGLAITVTGPNSTLEAWDCGQLVWLHQLHEVYLSNFYPHWAVSFPATAPGSVPGAVCVWGAYGVTFVNPNGAIVGGINQSLPIASSIESGARMSIWFPIGPGLSPSGAGFTFEFTESGRSGSVTLTTA